MDSKYICADGHHGNDTVCDLSQQCGIEDTGQSNLRASGKCVNGTMTEDDDNSQQSGSDLPECDGLSMSGDIQLRLEVNSPFDSHDQTAVDLQSVILERSLTESACEEACVASQVPPVEDSANVELEVVDVKSLDGSGEAGLANNGVPYSNSAEEAIVCDAVCRSDSSVQSLKVEIMEEGNGDSDTSGTEHCTLNDESSTLVDSSKQLGGPFDSEGNRDLSHGKVILKCEVDLQCGNPECSDGDNASCDVKVCDDNDTNDPAVNTQVENNDDDRSVNHFCCLGGENMCSTECQHYKDLIVRNQAASVIDEILQLATKHVVKMKFKNRNVCHETENVGSESNSLQNSDVKEGSVNTLRQKSKFEKAVVQYVGPFDIGNSLLRQSSGMGYNLSKSVPNLSLCNELIVQTDDPEFHNYIEAISGHFISPVCKQSIVLSEESSLFGCDHILKSNQSVSGILSVREYDEHARNSVVEQECFLVSKEECSKNCIEVKNDKEDSVALSTCTKNSISEFNAPRLGRISGEEISVDDSSMHSIEEKSSRKIIPVEQLHSLNLDAQRGALEVLDETRALPEDSCASTSENVSQKLNEFSDINATVFPDKNTADNTELIMSELNAEAKDLKDCLVSSEAVSTPPLDTQEQCVLGELSAPVKDLNLKDANDCENLASNSSPKDVIVDTSICLQGSHGKERNVESGVTSPDSCHENVSDENVLSVTKPELLVDVKDESISSCLENSEFESPRSQTPAQLSLNEFEEKCGNSNTLDIDVMVCPTHDSGDCEFPVEKEKRTLGNVSVVGDVPAPITSLEKDDDLKLRSSKQEINLGTHLECLHRSVINKRQNPVLLNDSSHPHEVCATILEEDYEEASTEDSELSHTASDSDGDLNMKHSKSSHDGINLINYMPLVEEDLKSRSTLSLISELDESCGKETNLTEDQLEDDSSALLNTDDDMDRQENAENVSHRELTHRVKGQRIKHDEDEAHDEEMIEDIPHAEYAEKLSEIKSVLKSNPSLERLRELACSRGGLVTDEVRREAWPLLLGIDSASAKSPLPPLDASELRSHPEYNQVVLDVNRSLRRFPSMLSPQERLQLQDQLTEIILRVLIKRRNLSYYQGYHDVAVTTLLVAGKDAAVHILERISTAHLSECMLPTIDRTVYLLNYIYPLLQRINPHLVERLDRLEVGTIFCLPWFLTWYGYSLNRYEDVVRVFDYFLASPPLAPLYLAAVVVGRRAAEVLTADCDQATVHSLLSRIPDSLPLEELLVEASQLYRDYPPSVIEHEVRERCERLRKAEKEEEERRMRVRQMRMVRRRHSMPVIVPRQFPEWFSIKLFIAPVMIGMIAWNFRNEMYRYF